MNIRKEYPEIYYPFSDELCSFMQSERIFYDSLKLAHPERFEFLPIIFTSHLPHWHKKSTDEIIGLWYLDKQNLKEGEKPIFKQDFIVNKESSGKEFHAYVDKITAKKMKCKFTHEIDDFYKEYGDNKKFYHREHPSKPWMHHYDDINDLPDEPNLKNIAMIVKIKNSPK